MSQLNIEAVGAEGVNTDYISELNEAGNLFDGIEEGGSAGGGLLSSGSYAELGINEDKVPSMQQAIEQYVKKLEEQISNVEGMKDDAAFFGTYSQGIADYVDAIAYGCKVIVGKLRNFEADLSKVSEAYGTFDTNLNSTLEGQKDELNSSFKSIEYQGEGATGEGATPEGN